MRKAQAHTQIFIYIFSIVIIGLVLLYGFKAVKKLWSDKNTIELADFKAKIESEVKQLRSDYGSERVKEYYIPEDFSQVCFVDLAKRNTLKTRTDLQNKYFVIFNLMNTEHAEANMFMYPDGAKSFYIGPISVADPGFFCANVSSGKIRLRMTGAGTKVEIKAS